MLGDYTMNTHGLRCYVATNTKKNLYVYLKLLIDTHRQSHAH